jgi:hypothetical protein
MHESFIDQRTELLVVQIVLRARHDEYRPFALALRFLDCVLNRRRDLLADDVQQNERERLGGESDRGPQRKNQNRESTPRVHAFLPYDVGAL